MIRESSHTLSAALSQGDGSCAARHVSRRRANYTGVFKFVGSFVAGDEGNLMTANLSIQYIGFEAKALVREYSFIVRRARNETSEFTLTIRNDAFGSEGVRFQDAPEICSLRLHRELAAFGNDHAETHYRISQTDLDDYRAAHAPKTSGYPYKPKVSRDL